MTSPATADRPVEACGSSGGGHGGRARRRAGGDTRTWWLGRWGLGTRSGHDARSASRWRTGWARLRVAGDAGMATAEYAIATIAAAGFAGLLVAVLRSDEVRGLLTGLVRTALSM